MHVPKPLASADDTCCGGQNGPMDFQVREPLHPLLGGLKNTNVMMETQVTQEYTGQGIHVVSLTKMQVP